MSLENKLDLYFKKGQSKTYLVTVTDELGARVDLTGGVAKMTIKDNLTSPTVTIAKSSTVVTEIVILSQVVETTKGQFEVYFVPSDTTSVAPGEYKYDVWVQLASGKRYPVIHPSSFLLEASVTVF
jgi:flavoprotein